MTSEVMPATTASSLEAELLRLLARQGGRVPIPVFLAALMIAAMAYAYVPSRMLGAWLVLVALVLAFRRNVLVRLQEWPGMSDRRRLVLATLLSALNGCTHAVSLTFFLALPEFQRAVQSLLLVGLCAGAVATTAGYRPVFLAYLVPVMAPLITLWALTRNAAHPNWIDGATAVILAIFSAVLMALASDAFRLFRTSFEIRLQHVRLNEQLNTALAAAEAANRAKTRFLASASHDLRQPVHALSLFAGALSMQPLDPASCDILGHMEQAIGALAGQLEALLDVSKLDAGVVAVRPAELALGPFFARVHQAYLPAAHAKNLQFSSHCEAELTVCTDPVLLDRLVCNLVDNAINYTETGQVDMHLSASHGQVVWVIQDSGIGISAAEQERVFEEFYQVGNSARDRGRGLGLGLAIVRRLATLLQLRLEMVSQPGAGTSFYLVFALHDAPAGADARPLPAAPHQADDWHVLVVDDDASVRAGM
ncbi:sensor histidine kinase [Massilia sp. S19_KUP03_FR1]|uniref:sensor histidine kinase n=1 Tax=Massilia sp. S19_KUP03_FR1 TaxID=3025503 RepID=UPI002FCDAE4E